VAYTPVDVIEVSAWGRPVGAVAYDEDRRADAFEYFPEWIEGGVELAPFWCPNRAGVFVFDQLDPATYHRLPAFIADSLPDRFGNALVTAWLADHGVAASDITALDRLAYAADRSMGALTFAPPAEIAHPDVTAIGLADLVVAARAHIDGNVAGPAAGDAIRQLISVGTSAGGARAKAVIAYQPETGQIRSGQLPVPEGFQHWLVKLDGVTDDEADDIQLGGSKPYTRIEYAYFLMATRAGLDMHECRLLAEGPRQHFLTRRFDRTDDGGRLHMQTLCALDHLDFNQARVHSYSSYLTAVERLELGPDALQQAFRRMVFNVAAANCDDHTKNLAFLADSDGTWQLAPAYDVTYAYNPQGRWASQHQMSVNGKFSGITSDDIVEVGDRFAIRDIAGVLDDVTAAVSGWLDHAGAVDLDEQHATAIADQLAARRLR
jgi:serine/threonine-protein kinase HipA